VDVLASYITSMTLIPESIKKWLGRNMLVDIIDLEELKKKGVKIVKE